MRNLVRYRGISGLWQTVRSADLWVHGLARREVERVNSGRFREKTDCLLVLDSGSFDNGPPSLRLSLVEGIESFRRLPLAREYLLADIGEPFAYCRIGERINDRGV